MMAASRKMVEQEPSEIELLLPWHAAGTLNPRDSRKVEEAVASGNKDAAQAAFRAAQPELQRAAGKGVLKANTVSRKISRLSAQVKAIAAP